MAALIPAAEVIGSVLASNPKVREMTENLAKTGIKKLGNHFFGGHGKKSPSKLLKHLRKIGNNVHKHVPLVGDVVNKAVDIGAPLAVATGLIDEKTANRIKSANDHLHKITQSKDYLKKGISGLSGLVGLPDVTKYVS